MANTIRYTINPKHIDASSNEVELPQYTADNTFTIYDEYQGTLATAGTLTIPAIASTMVFELISDYELTLTITESAGGAVATMVAVKNVILSFGTTENYRYAVTNNSGYTATLKIRQYA